MWKYVNCGTAFWYIRTDRKYHHCYKRYGNRSLKIRIGRANPTVLQNYYAHNLHRWLKLFDEGKIQLECYIPRMTMKSRITTANARNAETPAKINVLLPILLLSTNSTSNLSIGIELSVSPSITTYNWASPSFQASHSNDALTFFFFSCAYLFCAS